LLIQRLTSSDPLIRFQEIAQLHVEEIHHGILPLFGTSFLSRLYYGLASTSRTGVWAAIEDGKVAGFLAGCADIQRSYRSVMMKFGVELFFRAMGALFKPAVLKRLPAVFAYPFQSHKDAVTVREQTGPASRAELLAIAVDRRYHGRGVGKQLVLTFEKNLLAWGVSEPYWVTTNSEDAGSNAFYRALDFEAWGTFKHHELVLQRYRKALRTE
jgi:GNAT superfamily N-acetyltransferase